MAMQLEATDGYSTDDDRRKLWSRCHYNKLVDRPPPFLFPTARMVPLPPLAVLAPPTPPRSLPVTCTMALPPPRNQPTSSDPTSHNETSIFNAESLKLLRGILNVSREIRDAIEVTNEHMARKVEAASEEEESEEESEQEVAAKDQVPPLIALFKESDEESERSDEEREEDDLADEHHKRLPAPVKAPRKRGREERAKKHCTCVCTCGYDQARSVYARSVSSCASQEDKSSHASTATTIVIKQQHSAHLQKKQRV